MENFINKPVDYSWTEEDVILEYEKIKNKRSVAKIFCITVKQVSDILKSRGM